MTPLRFRENQIAMYLAEIWRYPVKSMAGERLEHANLTPSGIEGDRVVQVRNRQGRVLTARTYPGLLGHKATLDPAGEPLVDGRPWTDAAVLGEVRKVAGPGAHWFATTAWTGSTFCLCWLPPTALSPPSDGILGASGPISSSEAWKGSRSVNGRDRGCA